MSFCKLSTVSYVQNQSVNSYNDNFSLFCRTLSYYNLNCDKDKQNSLQILKNLFEQSIGNKLKREFIEKHVLDTIPKGVPKGEKGAFRSCNDFQLAILLQLEYGKKISFPVLEKMYRYCPMRLKDINSEYSLGISLKNLKLHKLLQDIYYEDPTKDQQLLRLFRGEGKLSDNIGFYGELQRISKDTGHPDRSLATRQLAAFDELILSGARYDSDTVEKLEEIRNEYIKSIRSKSGNKLDEVTSKLKISKFGENESVFIDKKVRKLFESNRNELASNCAFYCNLVEISFDKENHDYKWAVAVLSELHKWHANSKGDVLESWNGLLKSCKEQYKLEYRPINKEPKENPIINMSKSNGIETVNVSIDAESIDKYFSEQTDESFKSAFRAKLLEIGSNHQHPQYAYANSLLEAIGGAQVSRQQHVNERSKQHDVERSFGNSGIINPPLNEQMIKNICDLMNAESSDGAIETYDLLIYLESNPDNLYHNWANNMLKTMERNNREFMEQMHMSSELDLGDKNLNEYAKKVLFGKEILTSDLQFCKKLIDISTEPDHSKRQLVSKLISDCGNKDPEILSIVNDIINAKDLEYVRALNLG